MDKLDEIFFLQSAFDRELHENRHLEQFSFDDWMQKETIAIVSELCEMLSETNFKWWKNPKETNMDAIREELVDVLHFFVSMCIKAGLDADALHDLYISKNQENFNRQHGKSEKEGYSIPDEA
jgi:dimeric dUTPase (all-alpha-NTP-PPase superfamily)